VQRATLVASLRHERCFSRPKNELRVAEQSIQAHLPIEGVATAVTLMTEQSAGGQWARTAAFRLT